MQRERMCSRSTETRVRLEEVVGRAARHVRLATAGRRIKLKEGVLQVVVELHDGRLIAAAVAVVRRAEDRHDIPVVAPVVTLHDKLVGARHECKAVIVVERLRNVLAERVAGAARRNAPAAPVVGIGPEKVAHGTLVGDLLDAIKRPNVVERVDGRREAAVEAEDLVLHKRREGEEVKEVRKILPHVRVAVLAEALVVKAVHLRNLSALVVAAKDRDALAEADLKRNEERHRLHRVVATVDIIAHEEIVCVGRLAANAEQLHQVVELAVDIAAHRHGASHGLHIRLLLENFARLLAQLLDLGLGQLLAVVQLLNPSIELLDSLGRDRRHLLQFARQREQK
eukprot:Opistho-1_new@9865